MIGDNANSSEIEKALLEQGVDTLYESLIIAGNTFDQNYIWDSSTNYISISQKVITSSNR